MGALKLARRTPDPGPPEHLSEAGRATWRAVVAAYGMAEDVAALHILAATLTAEDLLESARAQVEKDGSYVEARGNDGGFVPHPMIRVMMRATSEARAGWKQLGLAPPDQPEPLRPGRPTRGR